MLTVGARTRHVEAQLTAGRLGCPGCGGLLCPWGHARPRVLRGTGQIRYRLRPRRARCGSCGGTHVLLPVTALRRRADTVAVIGVALAGKAAGAGHRPIAERLGRPESTVRGWLRRFAARAGPIRELFTAVLCQLEADPVPTAGRPVVLVWSKRLWRCDEHLCRRQTWSERHAAIAPRAALTERARAWATRRVGDDGETVAGLAVSWGWAGTR